MGCKSFVALTALAGLFLHFDVLAAEAKPKESTAPLGTASFTPPPAVDGEPLTSRTFVIRAAMTNMAEIELGELALARAGDPAVRTYARKMIDDHKLAQSGLQSAAASSKIAMPAALDEKHKKLKDSLSKLQGKEFDQEYAKAMASGHDEAVALFDAAAHSNALEEALQRYATRTLPVIRSHRDAAQALHSKEAE